MGSLGVISENTTKSHLEDLFHRQHLNKQYVRQKSTIERIEKIKRIKVWIVEHRKGIQEALYKDFRKPFTETDGTEILPVKVEIDHTIAHLDEWMHPRKVTTPINLLGSSAYIMYEPKGVVLIMAPWNFPFNLVISPLISAIAAGCCAIIKPSEITPHTSALLARMINELFATNEIAIIEGDSQVAISLLKLPFDHIFFTGSTAIGKLVMKAAAEHLTSVTLELGGKSPVVIDETANIQDTVEKIVWGKFINCGQTCVAPDYVFVHKNKEEEFLANLKAVITSLYGKTEQTPDYARIVSYKHWERLQHLIQDALQQGAYLETGNITDEKDYYISPTVLTRIHPGMQLMQEEIFGPVLPVLSYDHLNEVVQFISSKDKPLALYIFSDNKKDIEYILTHTTSGGVCINDCVVQFIHPDLPFGGVNTSGIGKAHGFYGFLAFSNERAVLKQRVGYTTIKMLYPPYTKKVKKLINLALKWL